MVTMPTTPTRNRDIRLTNNAQLWLILLPSKLISIISDAVAIVQCDDLTQQQQQQMKRIGDNAILLPLTPDDMTWSGWCGIMIIMLLNLYK